LLLLLLLFSLLLLLLLPNRTLVPYYASQRENIKMRVVWTAALFAAIAMSAPGQTPAGSDWEKVQAIPLDTAIRVSTSGKTTVCRLTFVDSDLLRCVETQTVFFFPIRKEREFPRTEVRSVKLSRQGLSTLVGTATGLGLGAGIGAAIDASAKSQEDPNLATALFGLLGALFGSGVGSHTDFMAGPTIYRAP
jgi:hypothetical protein